MLTAYCQNIKVDYHTNANSTTKITFTRQIHGNNFLSFGLINLHQEIHGFSKIWPKNNHIEWGGDCHLPAIEYGTCGLSINISLSIQNYILNIKKRSLKGSIHIINHAIQVAINLFLDENISHNLETEHLNENNEIQSYRFIFFFIKLFYLFIYIILYYFQKIYRILFYDKKPGGIGASEAIYHNLLKYR